MCKRISANQTLPNSCIDQPEFDLLPKERKKERRFELKLDLSDTRYRLRQLSKSLSLYDFGWIESITRHSFFLFLPYDLGENCYTSKFTLADFLLSNIKGAKKIFEREQALDLQIRFV